MTSFCELGRRISRQPEEEEDRQQGSHARWMNCQGLWGRVPAWLFDWVKPSSRSLLSSSCVWMLSSIAILLSVMSVIVIGDWVLSFLSLAAACSTASVSEILITSSSFCSAELCSRYQLSAAMTFLAWFLSLASSLFNLWLLPSL
ncbi:hypothetical protein HYC85_005408 [Camellia sinensis]|uniref:CASP-like protein n=1 Tax=Camellia sinensis TaxID=4442 RepID=A0A7J7HZE7_CAMSI|nr:hypothetical protein HYC85_005408 [Camellia sinensis]